ncbi:hypothetical protein [Actinomadura opuntiae]|uniref:hypothetical protein n=1 Tax=Actinomadura sp. OS1-43 TaxID=604315 RepID=UPI00255AF90E|nr:hypothetical protein [Actinomadura sp. OS1-43]MDL4813748.1 hypothetical protein [Actinomadura sp. OS1-43]
MLAVVHHLAAVTRLDDVLGLVEPDQRVQTVYTVAPSSVFSRGVDDHLRAAGACVVPFDHATQMPWDLAVAAGDGALERLHAPVLHLQHGMGPTVLSHRWVGAGTEASRPVAGVRREAFVAGGRVIPAAIALAHHEHRRRLLEVCPETRSAVRVVGEPAFDRMAASRPSRASYRDALGVTGDRRLVVVSSTWGPRGLFGRHRDLIQRLAEQLPRDRYTVVVALHPAIFSWHGLRQTLVWSAAGLRAGAGLLPPHDGWRAALIAADLIVGDHGTATYFGAASGVPVLLAAFPDGDAVPGSQAELLASLVPRLNTQRPLLPQIESQAGRRARSESIAAVLRDRLTSEPGRAAPLLRREIYRLLRLDEPPAPAIPDPVPRPRLLAGPSDLEPVR